MNRASIDLWGRNFVHRHRRDVFLTLRSEPDVAADDAHVTGWRRRSQTGGLKLRETVKAAPWSSGARLSKGSIPRPTRPLVGPIDRECVHKDRSPRPHSGLLGGSTLPRLGGDKARLADGGRITKRRAVVDRKS